jgi:hypothetical protein
MRDPRDQQDIVNEVAIQAERFQPDSLHSSVDAGVIDCVS